MKTAIGSIVWLNSSQDRTSKSQSFEAVTMEDALTAAREWAEGVLRKGGFVLLAAFYFEKPDVRYTTASRPKKFMFAGFESGSVKWKAV